MHSTTTPAIRGFVGQGCRCAPSFFLALSCRSNRSTAANENTDCNNDHTSYNTNNSYITRTNDSETIAITPIGVGNDESKGNGGVCDSAHDVNDKGDEE
jgi:hypothetical protein